MGFVTRVMDCHSVSWARRATGRHGRAERFVRSVASRTISSWPTKGSCGGRASVSVTTRGEPDAKGFLFHTFLQRFRATLRRSKAALFLVILASGELYSEGWNGGRARSAGAKARIQAMKLRNRIRKPNRQLSLKHFA